MHKPGLAPNKAPFESTKPGAMDLNFMRLSTDSGTDKGHRGSIILFSVVLACSMGTSNAQDLRFQTGAAYLQGVRPAVVQVLFDGGAAIQQYGMSFTYPASMLEPPAVMACVASAQCTVDSATHTVNVVRSKSEQGALGPEVACMMEFSAAAGATPGFALLSVTSAQFIGKDGTPVSGTVADGSVVVVPGESSPVWQFSPDADPDCRADSRIEVGIAPAPAASTRVAVNAFGSSINAQPVGISCGVSEGFILLSGGEQVFDGDAQPIPFELSCAAEAGTTGTLACLEGSSAGERFFLWDLVCADSMFEDGFDGLN